MMDFASDTVLQDDRLLLRPWRADDAAGLEAVALDPIIWKFTTSKLATTGDLQKYVAQALEDREQRTRYSFVICDKRRDEIVGSSSIGGISPKDRRLEIGWTWLVPAQHGTGVNTHAKYLLLKHCFEQLNAHRVEFKTDSANPRSCGALRKIGARLDGVLRSHTLMHDGRYRDTAYFSILESEWPQVRPQLTKLIGSTPV